MSDRPDRDPFEEELREALRTGTERPDRPDRPGPTEDSDDLLRRIRRGVARRRARRRAGAFLATAAAVAAIAIVVPLLSPTPSVDEAADGPTRAGPNNPAGGGAGSESRPGRRAFMADKTNPARGHQQGSTAALPPLRAGRTVQAEAVQVSSVSGGNDEYWVSASATCGQRLCNVLGHAGETESVSSFITLPGDAGRTETKVRFSGDGEIGWATNGTATYRTVNGGVAWSPLKQAADVEVEVMEAWGDQVWLVGHRSTRPEPVVLNDAPKSGGLRELAPPKGVSPRPELAVAMSDGSLGMPATGSQSNFVYTVDGGSGWGQSEIGCEPASLSATSGAVWALCDESTPTLVRSLDLGRNWESPQAVVDLALTEPTATVAAVSDDTAFVTSGSRAWVVESSVSTPVTGLKDGPYVYAGFTSETVGYVIDGNDGLYRTDNGGHNWDLVELP